MKLIQKVMIEEWEVGEVSIDQAIDDLKKLRKQHSEAGYFDLQFKVRENYDGDDWFLWGSRVETDEEYAKRLDMERKRQASAAKRIATQREKDLARFEKLKKKLKL